MQVATTPTRATRFAAGSAVFVVALGLTVLAGWLSQSHALIQGLPQLPPAGRNAAACLVLSGLALLAVAVRAPRKLVVTCAGIVSAVSILTLFEHVFGVDVEIDEVLGGADIPVGASTPRRMPPVSAICFGLISIGLFLAVLARSRRSARVVALDSSIIAAVGMATIMGYALGFSNAYGWAHVIRAPFLTAVGFLVIGLGMLALTWHVDPDPAGLPRWLPVSVGIGIATTTVGLWQGLIAGGQAPLAVLPAAVLVGGCLVAPVFGLTVYLAQRAHTQAAALKRSEAFLAEGQRLSMTGSFVWRLDTDEITFSAQLRRIFELETGPITLERVLDRVHPDDQPVVAKKIALARAGVVDHDYEVRLRMPDGSVRYLRTYAHANRHPDGHVEFAGAMQDVTQRRLSDEALGAARSELARVSRITSLGALTASLAHELNQPLSGIITNASTSLRMLATEPPNIDGARETARRTIRDGRRASQVIERLRALYSGTDLSPEPVDLNAAVGEVIALSLGDLQRNRVILRTELAHDLPLVTGDRIQLQQVVLNLLRNASDAMSDIDERPRELFVKTEPDDDDCVRLSVQDVGVGLAPEGADRLFGAFYTTKHDGMGMGLSVSRSIIDRHRGRLWAARNAGPGATFAFSIPRTLGVDAQGPPSPVRAAPPAPSAPRHPPQRPARSDRPVVGNS